ncbi:VMAP-C domain-containing protein [Streptomyces boluensis]|uniref:VMAP-C domain-containing protein n=1 Tax=Streptomyces boluensis TaxID=1775135 RepID=UPI0028A681E4|nr:trypsin-like peptidase domain-containing protein [Streptomyces boluensis]
MESADVPLHRAFVSVLGAERPVGAGVLIGPRRVLTCAHVVNSALGRDRFDPALPAWARTVELRLPHVDRERRITARVVADLWRPPRSRPDPAQAAPPRAGALPYYGDLAVLELDSDAPPGADPAPFHPQRDGNEVVAQWASGHALTTLRAVPRVSAHPWTALDVLGGSVADGFSGGPLWDRERQAVVGVIVAAHDAAGHTSAPADPTEPAAGTARERRASATLYAIGLTSIEAELPGLPPVAVPTAGHGRIQLLEKLEELVSTRQGIRECEERLAARLGRRSAGAAADVEGLAAMAMGVRRGVPELLDIVHDHLAEHRPDHLAAGGGWDALLRIARIVSPRERLTVQRRRNLNALLAHCPATDPGRLLRTVLPYAEGLPAPVDLADATDILEGYEPPQGRSMPPLLQGVVQVAVRERATGGAAADDLDSWIRSTARRLGVAPEIVNEFRADAAAALAGASADRPEEAAPPRVQVELLPVGHGRLFTYQIWVWNAHGRHEIVRTQDSEVPSGQVVADIREVMRTEVDAHPQNARLEFFVAPAWLRLDVDAWRFPPEPDDAEYFPGVSLHVMLRSSERTRETHAGWRRRSKALATAPRLLLDEGCPDPGVAMARLEVSRDSGIVVVRGDHKRQGWLLRQCLQAGVHTVLWHREDREDPEARQAADLLALVADLDPTHIPEAVRAERAKARAEPDCVTHHGRGLALLHDGPEHRPPPLAPDSWDLTQP